MGRLAGFRYREIVRKLKALGFAFDRQAAGSHEIWFNASTNRYTTVPNHPREMPEGTLRAILPGLHRSGRFPSGVKPVSDSPVSHQRFTNRYKYHLPFSGLQTPQSPN